MEDQIMAVLELFAQPAFFVRDGVVVWCNRAAAALFPVGTPLFRLLGPSQTPFSLWERRGTLNISLTVGAQVLDAAVQPSGEWDLFVASVRDSSLHAGAAALLGAAAALRKPLHAMVNAAETLFETIPEDVNSVQAASRLNRSIYRFLRLCGQMDEGGQLLLHRKEVCQETIEFSSFLSAFVSEVRPFVEGAGLTLQYTPLPAALRGTGDRMLLERALYNLLANALAYTPKGGTVCLKPEQRERELLISVSDSGEGMPSTANAGLIERFLERGIGDPRGGLGLGLPITREIARIHGGSLAIYNREAGHGTTAVLCLSLEKAPLHLHGLRLRTDPYGSFHHGLVELSDVLDASVYDPRDIS